MLQDLPLKCKSYTASNLIFSRILIHVVKQYTLNTLSIFGLYFINSLNGFLTNQIIVEDGCFFLISLEIGSFAMISPICSIRLIATIFLFLFKYELNNSL